MRSGQEPNRNGGLMTPSPRPRIQSQFQSTVSVQKNRRFNILILVFRFAAFCFSLASAMFMFTNSRGGSGSPQWYNFDAFRFVAIAAAIVALYSLFEIGASVWEISRGATVFPEVVQVWFDFSHDQVFAYMLLSADSAGTALARTLRERDTCTANNAFCVQSDISVALGFAGFMFLGFSSLLSGFRVICFILNGSRFHM
ncbi:CASP-like protein 4C2 isoform X1 [Nicotiana tabacum]|uniref:CASP-like protein n=1 Tax=Nicotiana tabacum TaxID=4097 RepID=A0A1S4CJ01_TOBAC|nr:CASP-like protein 4C2 isoform X1 [Nicotiana tomentosiformis]XP_016500988.1 PREDICTED: CASP-like protein 4C2 isoform X1 [Nicotiana tabacum]XP_016500989.1 PREDICTED: CASP-like protein 4C2 isoform X1 [Nicotiana tabacum]